MTLFKTSPTNVRLLCDVVGPDPLLVLHQVTYDYKAAYLPAHLHLEFPIIHVGYLTMNDNTSVPLYYPYSYTDDLWNLK